MKPVISLFLFMIFIQSISGQNDTVNQKDQQGNRTGYWIKYHPNGQIQYEGYFFNNLPVGTLNRYYPSGITKATLNRHPDSLLVHAAIFDEEGILRAKGPYIHQKKAGIWSFFSVKNDLILRITYKQDNIHGVASRYYANGNLMENTNWILNRLQGLQILYDEQGRKKAEINYFASQMHGAYRVFNFRGIIEINGMYKNGLKDGKWQYFKADGKLDYELIYSQGKLQNPEVMDSIQRQSFEQYEKNRLILKDPLSYLEQPSKYFRN
ncbi:MAG: hypothetical protein U9N86_07345 [Bacteroidota bacterium]|nr:hypothetical protein [Bacteroidota bacterium]